MPRPRIHCPNAFDAPATVAAMAGRSVVASQQRPPAFGLDQATGEQHFLLAPVDGYAIARIALA